MLAVDDTVSKLIASVAFSLELSLGPLLVIARRLLWDTALFSTSPKKEVVFL